jgi:predicted ATPase/signal transduction histidine kinase/GAF domain-containing protein
MDTSLRFKTGGDYSLQVLGKDGERVLCRGWRHGADGNRKGILAVLLASENPTPLDFDRLAREYELRDDLDSAWAVRPLELVREHGRTMLVLEDPGGEPLDRTLGTPMEVGSFLRLAIGVVTALGNVHDRGLVHKDLKPANIIVDSSTGAVWLTGFGIASRLPSERQAPGPPEVIAGTFAYMAPEQSGRMNRSIDKRSDLYACGVTFYEMLAGVLPFSATDPIEWIHCHIAKQPTPPIERAKGIPLQLSAIVIKLLAKTAEERYQTAEGVAADLRRCQAEWVAHGQIEPFPLGMQDASDRLMIPEALYGREREIDALLAAFRRVVTAGTTELVLVSGHSGIGKSSVVNELHKALVRPRALFASGKFDQYKRDIPYSTLAQGFQSLIRPFLGKTEADLAPWRDALRETLGPNGQLIVNLIPELELVIGPQPPIPDLPPQDGKNRFQMVFRRFFSVFAREEHPLVLFLDDLQWLDAATLELLEHLVTHPEVRHLLLVGAYRDNEVGPAHPLPRTFEAIRSAGARVEEIVLTPLGVDDIGRLISDALHCRPERAQPLAQLAHEKSSGNPFFAIQFIVALAEDGLLAFDPGARTWSWDTDLIRARGGANNVIDLMAEKLDRLSAITQKSLKQLACLGNGAEIATLTMVDGSTEEAMHATLWEAVHAGLVIRQGSAYNFVHDRVQQAAYALISEDLRAEAHVRIGRVLLATMKADEFAEHIFDIANQFNRGPTLLVDGDEKAEVAAINLRAGRKAKASAAHASACIYLAAGMALLDESNWSNRYELTFSLWLEHAECVFLTGDFETSEQHIEELLRRGASKVDQAATYHLKVQLHEVKGEYPQAVDSALACLRLFGIDLPAHPTWGQVEAEYETVGQSLNGRPIESLIDLPLMTDPDLQAAMRLLSVLDAPACFTSLHFYCLLSCRMANISIQHGNSGTSAHGYSLLGQTIGPAFHHYREGYRFGKLACDLVDKHGFVAYQARVHHAMGIIAFWTRPIATAIDFNRRGLRAAIETGDMTFACYSLHQAVTNLLLRNDPLDAVWRESELGLNFALKTGYRAVADIIVSQQRFIAALQGRTVALSTFNDARFDEAAFEAQLTSYPIPTIQWRYWILKLKARYLSGEYTEALAAADKAKALLWTTTVQLQLLDYFYYTALTVTAYYEKASADEQHAWLELLATHRGKLCEWTENYQATFGGKYALVSAEIARIEGRDLDAMRLYEQAIRSAREHGFVQEDGLANELAARFYAERGFEKIALAYLRDARHRYLRWGAFGKVRQLEELHPHLTEETPALGPTGTTVSSLEHLDLATIIKTSQAVSGEIVLEKLIGTLMRTAIEHAGAERGILILPRGAELRMEAEATTGRDTVMVRLLGTFATPSELPASVLQYVIRTQESVILDDATAQNPFSADEYIRQRHARSLLCLPLVKQTKLIGVLYLENNLASHVFTPARIAVLKLLSSQAAISLENARLYAELINENRDRQKAEAALRRSEASLTEAQQISHTGSWRWKVGTGEVFWSLEHFCIFAFDPATTQPSYATFTERIHAEDRPAFEKAIDRAVRERSRFQHEYRIVLPDGSVKHLQSVGEPDIPESGDPEFVGTVMDITERRRAEEALRNAQADLARVTRLTTMGELLGSIAHEINQPLAAVVANGSSGLRWLNRDNPDLDEARNALSRIVRDGKRAGDVIHGLRALAKKSGPQLAKFNINDAFQEVLALTRNELQGRGVVLRTDLSTADRPVFGDRIQLQQVLLNLIMNGVDAMSAVTDRPKVLTITSEPGEPSGLLVAVEDTGTGLDPATVDRIFDPFFTTKPDGMGMGLSICRSIIETHGGRLSVSPRVPCGTIFRFTVPGVPSS